MKKYIEPEILIDTVICEDVMLSSSPYSGDSWNENETPLIPFDPFNN